MPIASCMGRGRGFRVTPTRMGVEDTDGFQASDGFVSATELGAC
jgi:hypothetical protein